ncbi:MAG: hypothetical protein RLZZ78_1995 [Armatimonadota bacterium]
MEPYFGLLVIAIITIIFVAILGFVSVHITTRKYVPDAAGASKALALTIVSYVGSGMWVLAMFGTWQLTKKIYATTSRQTTNIAWQLLGIISLYFGVTLWRLISWMLQA